MSKSMAQATAGGDAASVALVTLDGRYHITERIAAGGMGEVYRAHDAVLAREVAIKVLHRSLAGDQGFVDRFRREARAAATLNHPNLVTVFDWGAVDGVYYMVMEYVHGRSVREILNARGALAPAQAAAVLDQTLAALDHAHTRGIVHRDLKPENILITTDGVVKVTDLGLARAFADAKNTRAGAVTGTVQYLAPEQIRGEPADPRSDLYSLGIVGFELLTDTLPFTGETPMAIAYKHLSDRVPSPSSVTPTVPTAFDGFIASATDPDREMRPESAAAMRLDLATFSATLERARTLASLVNDVPRVVRDPVSGEATAAIPPAAITQSIPQIGRHRRRRGRSLLIVLLALLTVAVAAWGAWSYVIPHSHAIPSVVGLPMDEASQQLHDLGFTVQLGDGRFDAQPKGTVLGVDPAEGTSLREGETVTLTPSLGPPPVAGARRDEGHAGGRDERPPGRRVHGRRRSSRSTATRCLRVTSCGRSRLTARRRRGPPSICGSARATPRRPCPPWSARPRRSPRRCFGRPASRPWCKSRSPTTSTAAMSSPSTHPRPR